MFNSTLSHTNVSSSFVIKKDKSSVTEHHIFSWISYISYMKINYYWTLSTNFKSLIFQDNWDFVRNHFHRLISVFVSFPFLNEIRYRGISGFNFYSFSKTTEFQMYYENWKIVCENQSTSNINIWFKLQIYKKGN